MKNIVSINKLTHLYDQRSTDGIHDLSFNIIKGEVLSLIGPSGSGKSTTLKCIAGMIKHQTGMIDFSEDVVISYVDQHPNLNEEQTVFENLKSAISHLESEDQIENQIRTTLTQLEITNEMQSLVKNISGGQKQRVIIAKALVTNPTLLLLDEPFANLDKTLRITLLEELLEIFKEKSITTVWVTHNTEEALNYSERVALLNYGKLQQLASPEDMYFRPQNMFTAQFFGHTNIIASKVLVETNDDLRVNILGKELNIPKPVNFKLKEHKDILLVIHPNAIQINADGIFKAQVEQNLFRGSTRLVEVKIKDSFIWIEINSTQKIKEFEKINFDINTNSVHGLDEV